MKRFFTNASELSNHRFDAEYHFALKRIELPSIYPKESLSSLTYFRTGGTPNTGDTRYWNGDIPWVSAKDFTTFRFIDSEDHITQKAIEDSTTFLVNRPALLMVSRSGILQHSLPVMVVHRSTAINQDIKAFFPDDRISVEYLGAFFDIFGARLLPLLCKSGATVQSLNSNELMALRIPIPPCEIQKRIVAELDAAYAAKRAADDKAAKLLASIDDIVLDALGIPPLPPPDTSLSARIFTVSSREIVRTRTDPYYHQSYFQRLAQTLARDHRTIILGKLGVFIRGVTYSSDDEVETGLIILRANNVSLETGELDLSDLVHVRRDLGFDDNQRVCGGDILICAASGSKEHAGKVAYVEDSLEDAFAGGFMTILRVDESLGMSRYVAFYMQSLLFRRLILRQLGGTNINNVSLGMLNALPIIVPKKAVQEAIVEKVSAIRLKAREIKANALSLLINTKKRIESEIIG